MRDPDGAQRRSGPQRFDARFSHVATSDLTRPSVHPDDSNASTSNLVRWFVSGRMFASFSLYFLIFSVVAAAAWVPGLASLWRAQQN